MVISRGWRDFHIPTAFLLLPFSFGVTQGETIQETLLMAADLLKILIADRIEQNLDLPQPSRPRARQYRLVFIPALQDAKAALY